MQKGLIKVSRFKVTADNRVSEADLIAVEEPLQIDISQNDLYTIFTITMRTPGDDELLTYGLLFSEGVISKASEIESVEQTKISGEIEANRMVSHIKKSVELDLDGKSRRIASYSGCGICGKTSIKALALKNYRQLKPCSVEISIQAIQKIRKILAKQTLFSETGGSHVAGIIYEKNHKGNKLLNFEAAQFFEDVGRHNALDKLIGYELIQHDLECPGVIVLSGRIGFELVQKVIMAGFSTIVALGAPTSLAIQTANQFGITLIGFAKNHQFNCYTF
jgi:FdhD protein